MASSVELFSQFGPNSGYVEELYQLFLSDPSLVGDSWAAYFSGLQGRSNGANAHPVAKTNGIHAPATTSSADLELQEKVFKLLDSYRRFGHFAAQINPLTQGIRALPKMPELDLSSYAFSDQDLSRTVLCSGFQGKKSMQLQALINELSRVYCGTIGFEISHIVDSEQRQWLQAKIESRFVDQNQLASATKRRMLDKLIEAEGLESELHKTYVGSKRFSLQGGETAIAMIDAALERSGEHGISDFVIGMAHRGRLNVLTHIIGKPYADLFNEFEDQSVFSVLGAGDVKYHLGYQRVHQTQDGSQVRVELAPNPSHLEFVNPVVEGMVRAKQDLEYRSERKRGLAFLIHGDAAFIGQGIVWETLNMATVDGYTTGGSLHLVINNQVGFTTHPEDARSSHYCTDLAKGIDAPVFHVNAEDVEASCWATTLALEFRQRFERDAVIDLYCYRKYGHNEGDDPSFTQPHIYNELASRKSITHLYAEKLISEGLLTKDEFSSLLQKYVERFQAARSSKRAATLGEACAITGRLRIPTPPTGVAPETLKRIGQTLLEYPSGFTVHPKLHKILEKRVETLESGKGIDWGFAEGLAFGSLVLEGHSVRLSGQDCGRGTFSQRHLELTDYEKPETYLPFSALSSEKARFEVFNSTLSENSVMGFEFGYSSIAKNALVLWEGQFGDFANGAQVIIDQFIASSEAKWSQLSGLVLMLPHGFEGQGPEHSSARLERFLQLCGEGNMVVAYPSSASQHFHLLRRQGLMEIKRPLIIMTPKSLLRLPQAACELSALTSGQFETVLEDDFAKGSASTVVFCTGKVFYDLKSAIDKLKNPSVKLIRIEQLYPFPQFEVKKALKTTKGTKFVWAQEEPQNMGAWSYIEPYLRERLELDVVYVGREVAASPATGSHKRSGIEQQAIVEEVLKIIKE
ncbi:MAG: 2-oxoglutarate dehydrogenase E1 component [Deltaproteobacteria bacterium]|nr:2-oxoglutarate dehydrogenase E1 component [Deltaproteobacteria bacterium]